MPRLAPADLSGLADRGGELLLSHQDRASLSMSPV